MNDLSKRSTIRPGNIISGIGFWTIFALLMGFGLPILIHSQQGDWKFNYDKSANTAFFYLGLGLFLWLLLIFLFANNFLFNLLRKRKKLMGLGSQGKRIKATVIESHIFERNKEYESVHLVLEFKNLSGSMVNFELNLSDSKPEEHRFDVGKPVTLLVDEESKNPSITLETGKIGFNKPILNLILFVLLVMILVPIGLLTYGYLYESNGYGWRYLSFEHPYILAPLFGLLYVGILIFIRKIFIKPSNTEWLLLHGKSTEAKIVSSVATGTSINDQPQILVVVEFEDKGKTIKADFKRIYNQMDLISLNRGNSIRILYHPENPQIIEPNQ